jgi:hypothetical protein
MTATNNGKEAARFVLVGPWTIHGVDHGYASGDAKGDHAAIQLTDIDCPYEGGWRNHAVTLPPGGSAAFSIRFSNRGLGSTKYTLDIPFEWKNDPGVPFEFIEVKDVPFNQ